MSTPVVELSQLRVNDALGAIRGIDLALPSGPVGALIGAPSDGTSVLAHALAGLVAPHSGSVLVGGAPPYASPSTRARIGLLGACPVLPDVGRVQSLFAIARHVRNVQTCHGPWFEALGLPDLLGLRIRDLDLRAQRTVALGLALAIPSPLLLVLHEPLADLVVTSVDVLRPILRERSESGTCVLLMTACAADAVALADDVATLQHGRIGRPIGCPDIDAMTPGTGAQMQIWADKPRELASALTLRPEIYAVLWSAEDGYCPLTVRATSVLACAQAIATAVREHEVQVFAMRPAIPSTAEINAASEGLALATTCHAAYESANRSGLRRG